MAKIKKRYFLYLILCVLLISSIGFICTVPDLSVEKITNISQTLTVYDKNGKVSAMLNTGENRQNISIASIPQHVKDALIATEDIRFYQHNGIDIKRIFGALWADISSLSLKQGASTITQQLIKNSHLTNEKTVTRKISEAILALQLERQYTKDEILEMYFNFVYFGRGAYGIQAAAKAYFGIDASMLSVTQGAVLVGILKAPGKYAPHLNMENALLRRNTVLSQMEKYGYISGEEYAKYKEEAIVIVEKDELPDYGYYTDHVLEEGAKILNISVSDLMGGGYSVYTTQDSFLQSALQEMYLNTDNFPDSEVQSAAVIIDNETGSIAAMIGGREHEGMRLYNRAKAKRQPGSCIKPLLVYGPALENKSITCLTVLDDQRKDFNGYSPTNYKDVYYGKVTVREALTRSLNVPAVELFEETGIEYSKSFAEKAGIIFDEEDKYLALALGGMKYGASALNLAGAYRTFASGGNYTAPWCIEKICDAEGNVLYQHKNEEIRVFSESTAFLITDMLCDVSKQQNNGLNNLKNAVACKTGTVGYNDVGYSDAWSTAYTKDYSLSVWMGYDRTDEEHFLDEKITGSTYPSHIASEIFSLIFDFYGYNGFEIPSTVTKKAVDNYALKKDGEVCLASEFTSSKSVIYEYFDIENAPQNESEYWQVPLVPNDVTVQLNETREAEIFFTSLNSFVDYEIYKGDKKLATLFGIKGQKLSFTDSGYTQGESYYIIPVHKTVYVSGVLLKGEKSREYQIH